MSKVVFLPYYIFPWGPGLSLFGGVHIYYNALDHLYVLDRLYGWRTGDGPDDVCFLSERQKALFVCEYVIFK